MQLTDAQAAVLRAVADAGGRVADLSHEVETDPHFDLMRHGLLRLEPCLDAGPTEMLVWDDASLTLAGRMALAVHEGMDEHRRDDLAFALRGAIQSIGDALRPGDSVALIDHLTADLRRALEVLADGVGKSTP